MIQIIIKYGRPIVLAVTKAAGSIPPILSWVWGTATTINWGTSTPDKLWGVPESATVAVNTNPPSISGTPVVGQTLTAIPGTWTGIATINGKWQRNGVDIIGATLIDYTLVQADAGNTSNITYLETATNTAGSASAVSNQITQILDELANTYIGVETLTLTEINAINQFYLNIKSQGYETAIKRMNIYANVNSTLSLKHMFGGSNSIAVNSPTFSRAVGYVQTGTSYLNSNINLNLLGLTNSNHLIYTKATNLGSITSIISGATLGAVSWWIGVTATDVISASFSAQTTGPLKLSNTQFSLKRQNSTTTDIYSGNTISNFSRTAVGSIPSGNAFDGARNFDGTPNIPTATNSVIQSVAWCTNAVDPIVLDGIVSTFISSL